MTKSAIITGGTGGLGIATAKILGKTTESFSPIVRSADRSGRHDLRHPIVLPLRESSTLQQRANTPTCS